MRVLKLLLTVVWLWVTLTAASCQTKPGEYGGDLLYGPANPPKLDQRLMTVCPDFDKTLETTDEESILNYIRDLGQNRKKCKENNQAWINWFKDTFKKKDSQ